MRRIIFLILILWSSTPFNNVKAGHATGGEITYKYIGNNSYHIIAKFYRDCRGISATTPNFGWFIGSNGGNGCGSGTLKFRKVSITDITPICKSKSPPCYPANTYGTGEGIEMHIYDTVIDISTGAIGAALSKSYCQELTFYMGQCCRNGAITTGPAGNDFYVKSSIFISNLNACKKKTNSSPDWKRQSSFFLCCNIPHYFNPALIDSLDYDSISYALVPGLSSLPSSSVSYSSPFSYQYPATPYCIPNSTIKCTPNINTDPPRGIFFDTMKGDFIFTPTKCDEIAVVVIEATEWRRDTAGIMRIVGKTRRDIQLIVKDDCGYNNAPIITGPFQSVVCGGDKTCLTFNVNDKVYAPYQSIKDTLIYKFTAEDANAEFTQITDTIPNSDKIEFCWQTSKADVREKAYYFSIEANDQHCPKPVVSSRGFSVRVKNSNDSIQINTQKLYCNHIALDAVPPSSVKDKISYRWIVSDSATSKVVYTGYNKIDTAKYLVKGSYKVELIASSFNYCLPTNPVFISIATDRPRVSLGQDVALCFGQNATINSNISNAKGPYKYVWSNTGGFTNPSDTARNFLLTNNMANNTIYLSVSETGNCFYKDTVNLKVNALPAVAWKSNPLPSKCHSDACFYLQNSVASPDASQIKSGNFRMWGNGNTKHPDGYVDSQGIFTYFFNCNKIDNNTELSSGKNLSENITIWHKDTNGCENTAVTTIRIHGNPIIQLKDTTYCQVINYTNMKNSVIRPKTTFGTIQKWEVLVAPNGLKTNDILKENGPGDWEFQFGNISQSQYVGKYKFKFTVTDQVTGCYTSDSSKITIVAEPTLTKSENIKACYNSGNIDLLQLFLVNGTEPNNAQSTFKIYSVNGNTNGSSWGGAAIVAGHYLSSNNKPGIYVISVNCIYNGCSKSANFDLTILPKPKADFTTTPKDTALKNSASFLVTNQSTISPNQPLFYTWRFDTRNPYVSSTAADNFYIQYPNLDSTYTVELVTASQDKCSDTFLKKLVVGKGSYSNIQNGAILPQFAINSQFQVLGHGFEFVEIWVFDMSGRLVYRNSNNDGIVLPKGNYSYAVQLKTENGKLVTIRDKVSVQ